MKLDTHNIACNLRSKGAARALSACLLAVVMAAPVAATAATKWVTSWAASPQGPYPSASPVAQPTLTTVFPNNAASDQTFRLIVRPDLWTSRTRIHFTNLFGTQPLTIDGIYVGLQETGATVVAGTNVPVTVNGASSFTLQPGNSVWTDAVTLPFVDGTDLRQGGRKLAISFHTVGSTGPMTWHGKALQTSYVTDPLSGSLGASEDDVFPNSTTSWYFIDKVDMDAPTDTQVIVALGDSITDGTSSTLNGDDRWPDVLSRRLHAVYGDRVVVVNEGIGGNAIVTPVTYTNQSGGPSALARVARDVMSLSGVTAVIWHEGTNDVSGNTAAQPIMDAMTVIVQKLRRFFPGVRIVGTTITSEVLASGFGGGAAAAAERIQLNQFIKSSGLFDDVADFYGVTTDPQTGAMWDQFVFNTSTGGAGDHIHPNRAGYLTMGNTVNIGVLVH